MKPFVYPFENPTITAGLALINATEPPFTVEAKDLTAWFKEGKIARYLLLDDIRALWGNEGLSAEFDSIFGEAKGCTLIASTVVDKEWGKIGQGELATYSVYALDTAQALYAEEGGLIPSIDHGNIGQGVQDAESEKALFDYPMPEPVLPRYEAEKIYNMIHAKPIPEKEYKLRSTKIQSRSIVEFLISHGFTDKDFQGSITTLQQKITNKGVNATLASVTEKTVIDWLTKGGVRK
ncbi:hypothetical protein [Xenorhabdus sp. Sc-CR9]|uniref:hypothetical protein n=1 Tax=Xenorhabdus sp. Sc-CR9 TaxID=2584468 RepID=UPI001F3C27FF|nr:hypothetical protein [Xenorhabdus sp. Sc-CR9]